MALARGTVSAVVLAVRNENVRRVELAWGAAIAAEWAHFVALGVFAYKLGGTSAVGLAGFVRLLPAAIVAPVAASFADRFPRERFLLAVSLVGAAALACSAAASFAKLGDLVYAFAAVVGLSSTLIRPTLQALLPSLARTPEELIASNAATSTIESLGTLVGPLLAGALIALAPIGVVFATAAAIAVTGAVFLTRVQTDRQILEVPGHNGDGTYRELLSVFEEMAQLPGPRRVLGLMVAQTFVRGCLNVLIVVAAFRILDAGAGAVGYMTAAIGVGGLVGALRAMTLQGRRLAGPFTLSLVFWGLPIALIAAGHQMTLALVLLGVVGAANSVEDVAGFTLLQRAIPDDALNRVLGVFWGLAMGAVALGSVAAPLLVRAVGPRTAFIVVGLFLPLITVAAYRGLKRLDLITPREGLDLIDRVPMFAPLSLATKERLATKLIHVSVVAGERVIRAGDPGDRFYVVDEGELDVEADGRREKLYADDYFGEIALLRDVPRTATVTAFTDSRLYALQRNDFLIAVTGHPAAKSAGNAVVDARLGAASTERSPLIP